MTTMRCARAGTVLLAAMLATGLGRAAAAPVPPVSFEIGPEIETFSYHEEGALRNQGGLFGGYMTLSGNPADWLSLQAFGSLAGGNLRYEGQSFDGYPLEFDVPSFLFNTRGLAGFPLMADSVTLTPFIGFGVRFLDEDLKRNYDNGYRRQTTYLYTPIGLAMSVAAPGWTYGLRAEYDLFWTGLNRNRDVPLGDGGTRTITVRQDTGYGIQAAVFAQRQLNRILSLTVEPFLTYWDICPSDVERVWLRDYTYDFQRLANQTWVYGLRVGLAW